MRSALRVALPRGGPFCPFCPPQAPIFLQNTTNFTQKIGAWAQHASRVLGNASTTLSSLAGDPRTLLYSEGNSELSTQNQAYQVVPSVTPHGRSGNVFATITDELHGTYGRAIIVGHLHTKHEAAT